MSIRFITDNKADAATLSSSDFAASLPVTNLQVEGRGKLARTSNATGTKTVLGNLAAAASINACVLYRHNLTSSATWRLYLYSAANQTGTVLYDSTAVTPSPAASVFTAWGWAFSVLYFTTAASVLSFKLELADATNPDGYLEAKRLVLGQYFEPAVNADYGLALHWEDLSEQRRTLGGSVRTDPRAAFRVMSGSLSALTEAERASFMEAVRVAGKQRELFVAAFPGVTGDQERDFSLLGKFTRTPLMAHHQVSRHRAQFDIQEV